MMSCHSHFATLTIVVQLVEFSLQIHSIQITSNGNVVDCITPYIFGSSKIGDWKDFEFGSGSMIWNLTLSNIEESGSKLDHQMDPPFNALLMNHG